MRLISNQIPHNQSYHVNIYISEYEWNRLKTFRRIRTREKNKLCKWRTEHMTDYTYRYNRNCVELKKEFINGSHSDKESAIFHEPIDKSIAKITSFYYFSLRMQSQNFALWNFMQIDWIYGKVWCDVSFQCLHFRNGCE